MILLFAIGNPLRRDDGAGHQLAASLAAKLEFATGCSTRVVATQQLAPEHALDVAAAGVEAVLFCDARAAEADGAGLVAEPLQTGPTGGAISHDLAAGDLLAYAGLVAESRGHHPPAWIVTAPGWDFDHGEGLSAGTLAALAGVEELVARLAPEIRGALGG